MPDVTHVAIQGGPGSFHALASEQYFDGDITLVPCDTFSETFKALGKTADYSVVAIENSLFGSINKVYDLLLKHRAWIIGEVYLKIEQCLVGLPGARIDQIKEVHTQAEAMAQCEEYLDTRLSAAKRVEQHDTAASVAMIKLWGDVSKAAIASRAASELHDLEVLADEIETNKQNYTRFIVLAKPGVELPNATSDGQPKTSIVLSMADKPGALYHALGVFAQRNINLSKLESRPVIGKAWHYIFYLDFEAGLDNPEAKAALDELKKEGHEITVLGSYAQGMMPPIIPA